ncbi:extracellular solute-binding protein [Limnothrix sp. FACHB-881]|uniref:extracellular solute-binding protein n=1 Tax=Limnothrix sp. FACHB-881 TaxID=2692819 RepID=UPI001682B4DE|nr:extracellular solute-binding protein [Limnothrix sp. FACHB-881]MBD2635208.1 extracellular solute-binding protein [Limnothrix sp. FACHB-881]
MALQNPEARAELKGNRSPGMAVDLEPRWGRRQWLLGTGAIAAGLLLGGCGRRNPNDLTVLAIENTVPAQLLQAFQRLANAQGATRGIHLTLLDQAELLMQQLQDWQRDPAGTTIGQGDWRSWIPFLRPAGAGPVGLTGLLGHEWLAGAVRRGWIQPWPDRPAGVTLGDRWQSVIQLNRQGLPDRAGSLWGIPYRWGTTVLVYRPDRFAALGWEPRDWADLWRPELRGKVVLLDRPREVIGLALKRLGRSYNEAQPQSVTGLTAALAALNQQALIYATQDYLQPLLLGDAWVAVGWSHEVVTALARQRSLRAVVPQSGTALWADLWVRPVHAAPESLDLATLWASLAWRSDIAQGLAGWLDAAPAPWLEGDRTAMTASVQRDVLLPTPEQLDRCELLQPLPIESLRQYQDLWVAMRRSVA